MRHEELSVGELNVDSIIGSGAPGIPTSGRRVFLDAANGSDGSDGDAKTPKKTFDSAYGLMTTLKNDQMFIYPGASSLSLASELTIAKSMCSFIGTHWGINEHHRSRFGASAAFTPMITVEGYGNTFANLYTQHGTAQGDYVGWDIEGHRNSFHNVHFGGPFFATQADHASYRGVTIAGTENYFKGCMFGDSSMARNAANYNVQLEAGVTATFEDCVFRMFVDGGDSMFVNFMNSTSVTLAYFRNCTFMVLSSNMATSIDEAFNFTSGSTAAAILDSRCNFINVTKIASSASDVYVYLARPHVTTTIGEGNIAEVLVS